MTPYDINRVSVRMMKAGSRRLSFPGQPETQADRTMIATQMTSRRRMDFVVIAVLACAVLGGCATMKNLVPWGKSDTDSAAKNEPQDDAGKASVDHAAKSVPPENRDVSSSSEAQPPQPTSPVDLSVPRVQRNQAAIADQSKSETATADQSGNDREAATPSNPQSAGSTSNGSAGADDWGQAVQAAIHRRWVQPRGPKIPTDFSCDVMVKLTPFGGVDDVKVVRSCGDVALDASVETAVRDSSPLPRPKDPADFSDTLMLTFTPR